MLRQALGLIVIVALFGAGYLLLTSEGRQVLDRASINYTRWQNHRYYRDGLPLPGTPDLARFDERLEAKGLTLGAPIFLRIFKLKSELEIWMEKDGRYQLFATYPICLWSGRLGPKLAEGDRQAPEGFYSVTKDELNPNSRWHRSFSLGFPNAYDRALGRTGSFIMVHGGCQSVGCFAMTNNVVDEIWKLVTAALDKGQPAFNVQVFPFRMTEQNLAARKGNKWIGFWTDLKKGYDAFETTRVPPFVTVCDNRYVVAEAHPGDVPPGTAQCTATASRDS
jgi:murein L,D-transpeptidase YafK